MPAVDVELDLGRALRGAQFYLASEVRKAVAASVVLGVHLALSWTACAALQSETPAYRDCIAAETPSNIKTIKADTQLKAEPNSSSKTVGILNAGTQVALLERTANGFWCHVQSSGLSGYVPFDALN